MLSSVRLALPALLALLSFCCALPAQAARPTTVPVAVSVEPKAVAPGAEAIIQVTVEVPPGLHAQSSTPSSTDYIAFKVTLDANPAIEAREPQYPKGEDHTYPQLGKLNVYTGRIVTKIPIRVRADAPAGPLAIGGRVQIQMCDDRVCYPPQRPKFSVELAVAGSSAGTGGGSANTNSSAAAPTNATATAAAVPPPADIAPATAPATPAEITPPLTSRPGSGGGGAASSRWSTSTAFGAALLAGLLFNVMPCVLPVLPLKAAAFHRAAEHHRSRSLLLGGAFSLGIISVFAVLAVLVLVMRVISWGSLFSNPIFVWGIVILLLICAAGMFGAFTFQLPVALYNVDPRQDTVGGNIVFGAFTAILATPCTAPLLPPLLLWASSRPAYVGVPAMLCVGIGMALPYLVLSATPELAKRFPRTGPWSELFKQMMGFMLLAAAAYFGAGRLIHGTGFWWVVVAVIAVAALYLMARTVQLTPNARPVGIAAALAVAMVGGSVWWTARITGLTQPALAGGAGEAWQAYSDDAFNQLRASGRPVLVKFTANWCATCQVIEGTVFRDPKIWQALKSHDVAAIKVDLTAEDAPGQDLLLKLNPAGGIPLTAIFVPGQGEPIVLASVYSSEELLKALDGMTATPAQTAAR